MLLGVHQPADIDVGIDDVVGDKTRHLGIDEFRAPLTSQGHPVVAVQIHRVEVSSTEAVDGG